MWWHPRTVCITESDNTCPGCVQIRHFRFLQRQIYKERLNLPEGVLRGKTKPMFVLSHLCVFLFLFQSTHWHTGPHRIRIRCIIQLSYTATRNLLCWLVRQGEWHTAVCPRTLWYKKEIMTLHVLRVINRPWLLLYAVCQSLLSTQSVMLFDELAKSANLQYLAFPTSVSPFLRIFASSFYASF